MNPIVVVVTSEVTFTLDVSVAFDVTATLDRSTAAIH
jgi:hypothetical protein